MNEAVRIAKLIKQHEGEVQELRITQAQLVTQVAREKLYLQHPDPKAQKSLLTYLKYACGLRGSTLYNLHGLGGTISPFCDRHSISLKDVMSVKNWGKLREALPALKRAARGGDPRAVRAILKDVREAPTRLWIRGKYRNGRCPIGRGFTADGGNGDLILVVRMNPGITKETLIAKFGNMLDLIEIPQPVIIAVPDWDALPSG